MKYEIEIDEDMLNGYKPVAFKAPEPGENYISSESRINNLVVCTQNEKNVSYPRLVVEKPREIKFRFCGHVKDNRLEAGKYYMGKDGSLIYNDNDKNWIRSGSEIWEKVDD